MFIKQSNFQTTALDTFLVLVSELTFLFWANGIQSGLVHRNLFHINMANEPMYTTFHCCLDFLMIFFLNKKVENISIYI